MKKYMVLALFVFCQSHAMEVELKPCYLSRMSCDILNYIASFLMETEEQFVARTRIQKELPSEYKSLFYGVKVECNGHWSFCPDETKIIAVVYDIINEFWKKSPVTYSLMIAYVYKNRGCRRILRDVKEYEYDRVALSCEGNLLARFYEEKECLEGEDFSEYIFKIQRVYGKKERNIYFPYDFYPDIIAFNKQGTHLIAHGKDSITKESTHKIFPLKRVDPHKPQIVVKTTNKLQEYLIDKCVCKYIEGKK